MLYGLIKKIKINPMWATFFFETAIWTTLSLLMEKIVHNYKRTHRQRQRWYFCVTDILLKSSPLILTKKRKKKSLLR